MVIKFFLIYIGVFLTGAVALVMVTKNFAQGFAAGGKKPVVQGSFTALSAAAVAYITTIFTDHLFTVYWVFAGTFLLFGIFHMLFFHSRYFYSSHQNKLTVLLAEIIFILALMCFIVVVFSSLEYFLQNKNFPFFPMMTSMLAFFIPLSVYYSFATAYSIPESVFSLWEYPLGSTIELPEERPDDKLLVIAFVLRKKREDKLPTNFRAKGPETMKLGDLYYHFINDYNEVQSETTIQYKDEDFTPDTWGFRAHTKWYQPPRVLDPCLSVRENRLKENSIVICERLKLS